LQVKLLEAQRELEEEEHYEQVARPHTSAVEKKEKEEKEIERQVTEFLDEGHNTEEVAYILDIPLSEVETIEEHNREKMWFLATGELPEEP
jgi:hypothetical protein